MPNTKTASQRLARIHDVYRRSSPDRKMLIVVMIEAIAAMATSSKSNAPEELASAVLGNVAHELPWMFSDAEKHSRLMIDNLHAAGAA